MSSTRTSNSGGALLAVLWLSAALSAIAFSLANNVRAEVERTTTEVDDLRAYYLATGALQRALLWMEWGPGYQRDGKPMFWGWAVPELQFEFPSGQATVRIVPESAKLNINQAPPEDLFRLMTALGVEPSRAREITLAILDWRSGNPLGPPTAFDQYYLSLTPSFRSPHASFEEVEQLLLVKGMTPDLFYGSYERNADGRLVARGALRDCVTVYGAYGQYDVNTAPPAVLSAIGVPPDVIAAIVQRRRIAPLRTPQELGMFGANVPGFNRLRVGGNSIYTLRATAVPRQQDGRLSDARRSVGAMVKFLPPGSTERVRVLRWYDREWVQ